MICVVYALIGIPLNFAMLAGIGDKMNTISRTRINPHLMKVVTKKKIVCLVRMILTFCLGWVIFIQLPALYIAYTEDWDYISATYFAFTTLSTIGFGDLSPGKVLLLVLDHVHLVLLLFLYYQEK